MGQSAWPCPDASGNGKMVSSLNRLTRMPAFLIPLPGWQHTANTATIALLQSWGVDCAQDRPIPVAGIILQPKAEHHLTLANTALVAELQRALRGDVHAWLQQRWQAGDTRILPTGQLTLLHKRPDRAPHGTGSWSLVEAVIVPGQKAFLRQLEHRLGRQLPRPPAHVTTHVAGRPQGIGLPRTRLFSRYAGAAARAAKSADSMTPIAPQPGT